MTKAKPSETKQINLGELVKKLLAEHIGVESEDINSDDSFREDLHMSAADLSDFIGVLERKGFNTAVIDLGRLETVDDLIETLSSEEEIK